MSEERRFGHHDYKHVRRAHANLAGLDQQQCEAVLSLLLTERDAAREEMAEELTRLRAWIEIARESVKARGELPSWFLRAEGLGTEHAVKPRGSGRS